MGDLFWILIAIGVVLLPMWALVRHFRKNDESVPGGSDIDQIFRDKD